MILSRAVLLVALVEAGAAGAQAPKGEASFILGGNSKEPININAQKLDYFDKEQKLVYSGGVSVTRGETHMKASTMTIFLLKGGDAAGGEKPAAGAPSANSNSVRRMEAAGPVTIASKDQVGTGDNLVYDKAENKVYLNGHAVLSQGPNITKGDTLIYDLNTSQARVTGHVESVFTPGSADPAGDAGKKPPKKPKSK